MGRLTLEDCIDKVENRFELILVASHRARMISSGSKIPLSATTTGICRCRGFARNRRNRRASFGDLKEDLIHSLQKYVEVDKAKFQRSR